MSNETTEPADGVPNRLLETEYMALKHCKHGTFIYNRNDSFIGRSLDLYGEWCESELILLQQIVKPGQVVLDVGANIGSHTVFFAKQVTPTGLVYAFEPQRLVFQNLCANIALNALVNVITRNIGLGDERTTIQVPTYNPRRAMNFGAISIQGHTAGEPIEVMRIDDMGLARCDLIKIDVEGMEANVLSGGRETITKFRPVLFVENNQEEHSEKLLKEVDSLGYDSFWHLANYYSPQNFFGNQENIFAQYRPEANILCFHRSATLNLSGFEKVTGTDDTWRKALNRLASRQGKANS